MRIFTFTLVLLASAMMFRPAIADAQALEAIRICNKMVKQIDLLVEYTKTLCVPAQGRNGMSFFFVSQVPIFSIEASKKWWLLVVAGVFGETFNANAMKSDEVAFSDVSMLAYPVNALTHNMWCIRFAFMGTRCSGARRAPNLSTAS